MQTIHAKRYGCAPAGFDEYDAPSTKDAEHSRCVASSSEVLVEDNIQVPMSQQEFLGNTANKVPFIALLTSLLEATGCEVHHASADADRLIVLTHWTLPIRVLHMYWLEKTHTFSSC